MKVFLKIVENYNLAACSKEQANQETKSTRCESNEGKKLFHCKQIICETQAKKAKERSSSNKEHKVNALASGADEGRDKLR